jgi:hypothetical protein
MFAGLVAPSHSIGVVLAMLNTGGAGLTVIVVCCVVGFEQPFAATLNVYVTRIGLSVGFTMVSVIF